jgi:hypothetical protein
VYFQVDAEASSGALKGGSMSVLAVVPKYDVVLDFPQMDEETRMSFLLRFREYAKPFKYKQLRAWDENGQSHLSATFADAGSMRSFKALLEQLQVGAA